MSMGHLGEEGGRTWEYEKERGKERKKERGRNEMGFMINERTGIE